MKRMKDDEKLRLLKNVVVVIIDNLQNYIIFTITCFER